MTIQALTLPAPKLSPVPAVALRPEELLAAFDAHLELAVRSDELALATAQTYRGGLRRFTTWLERGAIMSVGADDIRQWRGELIAAGLKPSSVNVWLSGVKAFYAWAVERGHLSHNPAADLASVKRKASTRHVRDALTSEEARRLLELKLPPRDAAIIRLMLYTGARSVEVSRANVEDIVTRDGELVLMVQGKGRGSDEREPLVLAHPAMQRALMAWLAVRGNAPGYLFTSLSARNARGRLSLSAIRTLVVAALRDAGIARPGITTHSLRHTAITTFLRLSGGNIRKAQVLGRHKNINTTLIYAHELTRITDAPERAIDYGESA